MVVSIDDAGRVSRYCPARQNDAVRFEGSGKLLDGSTVLDDTTAFSRVYATAENDIFLAGTRCNEGTGANEGVVYHYDGASWWETGLCLEATLSAIHGREGNVFLSAYESGLFQYIPAS